MRNGYLVYVFSKQTAASVLLCSAQSSTCEMSLKQAHLFDSLLWSLLAWHYVNKHKLALHTHTHTLKALYTRPPVSVLNEVSYPSHCFEWHSLTWLFWLHHCWNKYTFSNMSHVHKRFFNKVLIMLIIYRTVVLGLKRLKWWIPGCLPTVISPITWYDVQSEVKTVHCGSIFEIPWVFTFLSGVLCVFKERGISNHPALSVNSTLTHFVLCKSSINSSISKLCKQNSYTHSHNSDTDKLLNSRVHVLRGINIRNYLCVLIGEIKQTFV